MKERKRETLMADKGEQGKFASKPPRNSIIGSAINAAAYPGVVAGRFRAEKRPLRSVDKLKALKMTTYTGNFTE